MVIRPWTEPILAPTLVGVTTARELLTGPSGAVCFIAALRSLWLLPDWLAKWLSLVANRHGSHDRDHANPRGSFSNQL
jgi:hypothetical protein